MRAKHSEVIGSSIAGVGLETTTPAAAATSYRQLAANWKHADPTIADVREACGRANSMQPTRDSLESDAGPLTARIAQIAGLTPLVTQLTVSRKFCTMTPVGRAVVCPYAG
jgi:hypothetical protein